jgi:hypothetical protein
MVPMAYRWLVVSLVVACAAAGCGKLLRLPGGMRST